MSEQIISNRSNDEDEDGIRDEEVEENKGWFPSTLSTALKEIPWKLSFMMFFWLLILFSKQFIEHVLGRFRNGSLVDGDRPTSQGVVALSLLAVLGLIVLNIFIKLKEE
jgi:hypothetical protein